MHNTHLDSLSTVPFEIELESIETEQKSKTNRKEKIPAKIMTGTRSKPSVSKNVQQLVSAAQKISLDTDNSWRENLLMKLDEFLTDADSICLEFQPDLQSYERRLVHEVEKLGRFLKT